MFTICGPVRVLSVQKSKKNPKISSFSKYKLDYNSSLRELKAIQTMDF